MPKLTPVRVALLRERVKELRREMLLAFVLGVTLAVIVGYAGIVWETPTSPLDLGLPPAIGDVAGLLVAAPFMTAVLVLRSRLNGCLEELNPTK